MRSTGLATLALGDLPLNATRELSQQIWIVAFEEYHQWSK